MNGLNEKRFQPQLPTEAPTGNPAPAPQRNAVWPLSSAQERILRLSRSEPSRSWQTRIHLRLRGALKRAALQAALDRIVARHEILRTTFGSQDGALIQQVGPPDTGFALGDTELPQMLDLERGPLICGQLVRTGELEHVLVLGQHPIVADTWSVGILLRELAALYSACCESMEDPLPPLEWQFADYVCREREQMSGERFRWRREYWARALAQMPERLALPVRTARIAAAGSAIGRLSLDLPEELYFHLQTLAHRKEMSLFVPLLCGWAVLLGRWAGQDDVVIGARAPNRPAPELERLIGPLENLVALRVRFPGDTTVDQLLKDVKAVVRKARSHQDVSFEQVMADLSLSPEGSPPLQALMSMNGTPQEATGSRELRFAGLEIEDLSIERAVFPFELALSVEEGLDGLKATLEYAADLFEPDTAERLLAGWQVVLGEMVTDIYQSASRLPIMTEEEKRSVLFDLEGTAVPYPEHKLVHQLVEEQVARTPGAVAVEHEGRRLTYAQLNRRANQLARYLLSQGVAPDQVVGICLERGLEMVVGLLAILKAGGAYLPLDPNYPAERLKQMLEEADPQIVLTETELMGVLPASAARVIALDEKLGQIAAYIDENVPASDVGLTSWNLLYVICTSGSTGRPKGTAMAHRSMVNLIEWHRKVFSGEGARVLQFAALSFDVAFQEIFSTLCTGGSLVLLDEWVRRDVKALARLIESRRINRVFLPPLMLQSLAEHVVSASDIPSPLVPPPGPDLMVAHCRAADVLPKSLKDVVTAGEQLRLSAEIRDLFRSLEGCRLHNHYGPTETHVVTALTLEGDPASWPDLPSIGRPIANTWIRVLDRMLQPVPIGMTGEIYIGGANVARGYLHQPDLTGQRFMADPWGTDGRARLYKTGDLGRWRADGTLEYLGRNDDQVKIRGFRIELGEIESRLARCARVRDAVVVAREDVPGEKRLVAYVTPRDESLPLIEDLRKHLKGVLPDYMVPSAFVVLAQLPVTPSGKLDRRTLPPPGSDAVMTRVTAPPQPGRESILAGIWQDLLRIESVGRNDNFFELGGHSYLIVQMMERLRRVGLSADVRQFFQSETLADLADALITNAGIDAAPSNRIPPGCETITPDMLPLLELSAIEIERITRSVSGGAANVQDIYPLAPLQEGILFHHLLDEQRADTYVLPALLAVPSRDRLEDLIAALQAVIDRHDVLRTAVLWDGLAHPVQVVYRQATLPVEEIRLDSSRDPLEQMRERMRPERQKLEIGRAPMLRLQVAAGERDASKYALLQIHHLACDHESLEALLCEVMAVMEGNEGAVMTPRPYRDHVAQALAHARGRDAEAFFRSKLGEVTEPTAPFGLLDVHGDGSRVEEAQESLSFDWSARIRAQARRWGVSPAVLFHAAWALVVSGTSGRDDVVFGTVLLGRLQGSAGAGSALGMFMNTLPLRLQLAGLTVKELIALTSRELVELVTYEQAPLASAQRCSGLEGSAPLFTTLLNYRHSTPGSTGHEEGKGARVLEIREWTNYPIALSVDDLGEEFTLSAQTDDRIGSARVAAFFVAALENLVQALESAPQTPALSLSVLSEHERRRVLEDFNSTDRDYPSDRLVHELYEERAEWTPDAIAVLCNGRALTYAELNRRANQIAWCLRAKGIGPDRLVGIFMERGLDIIAALLGVLKAGGAYVPLDPSYPAERIAHVLRDAAPRVVLTQASTKHRLPDTNIEVLAIDDERVALATRRTSNPPRSPGLDPACMAYAIYTSGSTGVPKGVMIEHRSLSNLIHWHCEAFHVSHGRRCSSVAAIGFDAMVWEVWPPLAAGATLVLPPAGVADDVQALMTWWAEQKLDVSFLPTPLAEFAFSRGMINAQLHWLLVGGDRLRSRPQSRAISVINNYGPTESTVVATSGPILPQDEVLHIGRPIANTRIYILDSRGRPVPAGVAGEMYIGGAGVARGYLNRPDLTAERFLPDPFTSVRGARMYRTGDLARWRSEGTIEYLGRNDEQVKIRGFRIELGEIEAQLSAHPQILEAAVRTWEPSPGDWRLAAYLVPRSAACAEDALRPESLRAYLKEKLPEYMVPGAFVLLERLPLTANGKLDRRALPPPDTAAYASGEYEAPRGRTEETLAAIWREVLNLERVGRHDGFFDLGGNSLTATQVMVRIRSELQVKLPVGALFERPALMDLALRVDRLRGERLQLQADDASVRELFEMVSSMSESEAQRLLREMTKGARV